MCLMLELAAAANGLPLEFFARVIWEESRFQPNTVGPMTRSGHRAQGIAQFMPYTADERGLLDPFNPETALPKAAEFLAELRSEFGNLGLAAAAYNAGPGRVRDFLGGRGGMPAQTRYYVRAVTGRSVDEWAALGREGGKDGIPKPTSCGQLAALLKEQPSFFIGKTRPNVREAASSPQAIADWRNASATRAAARPAGTVAARNRNPLQVRTALLPSTDGATRRPKTSPPAASAESGSSSAKPGKPGNGRSTSVASTLSDSKSASDRLRVVSPKESARENSATRAAARPARTVGTRNRNPLQVRTALLPSTDGATRQRQARRPRQRVGKLVGQPGKSGNGRSTSVASTLSDSKSASDRLRAVSPKESAREFRNTGGRASGRKRRAESQSLQVALHHCRPRTGPPGDRRRARRPRQQSREARRPSQANQENRLVPLGGRHPCCRRCRTRGRCRTGYKWFRRREVRERIPQHGWPHVRQEALLRGIAILCRIALHYCRARTGPPGERRAGRPRQQSREARPLSQVNQENRLAPLGGRHPWRRPCRTRNRRRGAYGRFCRRQACERILQRGRPRVEQEASLRGMHYCRPRMGPAGNPRQAHRPSQQSREVRRPSQANQENRLVPLGGRRPQCRRCRTRSRRRAG